MQKLLNEWRKYLIEAVLPPYVHPGIDLEYAWKLDGTVLSYVPQEGFQPPAITLPQAIAKSSKPYVIVNFMGLWCNPCIHEFPFFKQFIAANKNFDFYMVDIMSGYYGDNFEQRNKEFLEFQEEHGRKLPLNTKIYGRVQSTQSAPDTYLVRKKDGAIYFHVGGAFKSYQQLDATIRHSIAVKEKTPRAAGKPIAPIAPTIIWWKVGDLIVKKLKERPGRIESRIRFFQQLIANIKSFNVRLREPAFQKSGLIVPVQMWYATDDKDRLAYYKKYKAGAAWAIRHLQKQLKKDEN